MAPPAPSPDSELAELARAARLLEVRARREAVGVFAGAYRSAFRGGGIEFEEFRPYAPGDDPRSIDWNASARSGALHVKRFREERDRTLLVVLDASASMGFGSGARSKAQLAARSAALLAAAAGRAGDRVGLVVHGAGDAELPPARGLAHAFALVRAAARAAAAPAGATDLAAALARARRLARRRSVLFVVSDFRDPTLLAPDGSPSAALLVAARRHELVAAMIEDPLEVELPAAGALRIADPERPGRAWLLQSGDPGVRERYRVAAAERQRRLARAFRRARADALRIRTDEDPLLALLRFFRAHSGRVETAA